MQQFRGQERRAVGDFEANTLAGQRVDASTLSDRATVVNVWGSWCGPCRSEAPILRKVALDYEPKGVKFLGLNVRDNDAAAQAFERRFAIPYKSVRSADSPKVSLAFSRRLSTTAVPMTVVVGGDRRVSARVLGAVSSSTLRGLIDDALAATRRTP